MDSPRGEIVFQRESVTDGTIRLLTLTIDDAPRPLRTGSGNSFSADWSPDGRKVVFVNDRSGSFELEVHTVDGRVRRRLQMPGSNRDPAWSESGRIAFVSDRDGNDEIYVTGAGRNSARLTRSPTPEMEPAWAPDGRRLVFVGFTKGAQLGDLVLAQPAVPARARQLVSPIGEDFSPSWSPDGNAIAFASTRGHWRHSDIYVIHVGTGKVRRLTRDPGNDYQPDWSPDGRWIVFVSDRDANAELYVVGADGRNQRRLTHDPGRDEEPSWRPITRGS
jgi:TolB protein